MPRLLCSVWVLAVLAGCAVTMQHPPAITTLPALQVSAEVLVTPQQALAEGDTPALLALNAEMREFVDLYVRGVVNPRSRLELLHSSLRSGALHGLEYDPDADGSAALAFETGQANCLAYANLFVAMARYAGLNAHYQLLTLRPYFSRFGTRVAVEQHVNVQVRLPGRSLYSVDLDPPPRDAITHTRKLADKDAFALYHNNLAMQQLQNEELKSAFTQILQALTLSPQADYLWINLGVIYSRAGQTEASAQSYHQALALNPDAGSAMNNLLVLHSREGDMQQVSHWEQEAAAHRRRNPYYYVSLGEAAALEGEFEAAVAYYQTAIERKDTDPEIYFSIARLYLQMEQPQRSIEYAEKAIKHAVMRQQRREYEAFLQRLTDPAVALL